MPRRGAGLSGRREAAALAVGAASAVGVLAVGVIALAHATGRRHDAAILQGFTGLDRSRVDPVLRVVAVAVDPLPFCCVAVVLLGACLAHRRVWRAIAVMTVLIGSGATAQVLKQLLAQPRRPSFDAGFGGENFHWPSGHATAATALAICAVIVAPPAWRVLVAVVAGGCALAVAYATLALAWHYPSEVLAGILLAGAWGLTALGFLARHEPADPATWTPRAPRSAIALGAVVACIATAIVTAAASPLPISESDRVGLAVSTMLIATLTIALLAATIVLAPPDSEYDEFDWPTPTTSIEPRDGPEPTPAGSTSTSG